MTSLVEFKYDRFVLECVGLHVNEDVYDVRVCNALATTGKLDDDIERIRHARAALDASDVLVGDANTGMSHLLLLISPTNTLVLATLLTHNIIFRCQAGCHTTRYV